MSLTNRVITNFSVVFDFVKSDPKELRGGQVAILYMTDEAPKVTFDQYDGLDRLVDVDYGMDEPATNEH